MKLVLVMEVGLSPGDFVLDGDAAPSPKRGQSRPQFSTHFYCGQTAGCIKVPLSMEVGLSPGDFVLDGVPVSLPQKGWSPQIFGPRVLWPNGCMDQDAAWYGGRRRPTRHCVRWGPSSPSPKGAQLSYFRPRPHCIRLGPSSPRKGHSSPSPSFRPMSIVATVAHFSYC